MKNFSLRMRKSALLLCVLLLATSVLFSFAACDDQTPETATVTATLTVCDLDKTVLFSQSVQTETVYLDDLLKEFAEADLVVCTSTESAYGAYISAVEVVGVKTLSPQTNQFISVYHDISTDVTLGVSGSSYNVTIGGKEYLSSTVGASALPVQDGATYVLMLCGY